MAGLLRPSGRRTDLRHSGDLSRMRCLCVLLCVACVTTTLEVAVNRSGVAEAALSTGPITASATASSSAFLNAVSCTSSTFCEAVGYYSNSSGVSQNLIETWNGTSWTIATSPDEGSNDNYLYGVSCTSSTFCEAVGYYSNSSGVSQNLIETWNGTSWTIATSPDEGSNDNYLYGVSCTSSTFCEAVGYYNKPSGSSQNLIETWNGTSWTIATSPQKKEGLGLDGVSCTTPTFCEAVGSYTNASTGVEQNLIETWNGTTWATAASPDKGGLDNSLVGSSCKNLSFCAAVGSYTNAAIESRNLVETWNGTSWAIAKSPSKGNLINFLSGVACAGSRFCEAVGNYENSSHVGKNLIETWNGTSWAITTSPDKGTGQNALSAVSCSTSRFCEAVGFYYNSSEVGQSLIETWNGSSWQIQAAPPTTTSSGRNK